MSDQPVVRPPGWGGGGAPPVWPAPLPTRPVGPWPVRPTYREPLPVRGGQVALGIVGSGVWMLLVGAQSGTVAGYAWLTLLAGTVASGVGAALLRAGDRGVAIGTALAAAVAVSTATVVVGVRWASSGSWPLW